MDKVYCGNCKHLLKPNSVFNGQTYFEYHCIHPTNLNDQGNWLKDGVDFVAMPNEINADNSCLNFEQAE